MQYLERPCCSVSYPVNDSRSDFLLDIQTLQTSPSRYEYARTGRHQYTFSKVRVLIWKEETRRKKETGIYLPQNI